MSKFDDSLEIPLKDKTLLQTKEVIDKIQTTKSPERKRFLTLQLMQDLIHSAEIYSQEGDFYEAAEIFYSAGYLFEEIDFKQAQEIYRKVIEFWEKFIESLLPQGKFREAGDVHRKIGLLYSTKFNNQEEMQEHLLQAIYFFEQNAKIRLNFNETKKAAQDYQNIAVLYAQLHDWPHVIVAADTAIEIARQGEFYEIFASAVEIKADAYSYQHKYLELQENILEAIDVLSFEASLHEEDGNFFEASQLFEILKRLYQRLPDMQQYSFYTVKEAGMYIAQAEQEMQKNNLDTRRYRKIANLYRGAGLCYRNIEKYPEAGTCFFLSAKYYTQANDFANAATNLSDAATQFQETRYFLKSRDLFCEAGRMFEQVGVIEEAVENQLLAFEIKHPDTMASNITQISDEKLAVEIANNFQRLGNEQFARENFHIAGTLFLEAARYLHLVFKFKGEVGKCLRLASRAFSWAMEKQEFPKESQKIYATVVSILCKILLGNLDKARKNLHQAIESVNNHGIHYLEIATKVLNAVEKGIPVNLTAKQRKLVDGALEVNKLLELIQLTYFTP